jgi:carbonic anhydrase
MMCRCAQQPGGLCHGPVTLDGEVERSLQSTQAQQRESEQVVFKWPSSIAIRGPFTLEAHVLHKNKVHAVFVVAMEFQLMPGVV